MNDFAVSTFGRTPGFNPTPDAGGQAFQLARVQGSAPAAGPDLGKFRSLEFGQRAYVSFGEMVATGQTNLMDNLVDERGTPKAIGFFFDNIPAGTKPDALLASIRENPAVRAEIVGEGGKPGLMADVTKAMQDYTHFAQTGTARGEFQPVNLKPEDTALGQAARNIFGVANNQTMSATFMALSQVQVADASATRGGGHGTTHREVANADPTKFQISHQQIAQGLQTMTNNPTSPEGMRIRAYAQEVNNALQQP